MELPERSTILSLLRAQAGRAPDAVALRAPERPPLSHAQLCAQVRNTADALGQWGLGRGDRVAIVLPNGPEMATAFLAVSTVATSAPLNPGYRSAEFAFYLDDLNAKALIVAAGTDSPARAVAEARGIPVIELSPQQTAEAGRFELALPRQSPTATTAATGPAQPNDVALVLHTSGTTSRPKMVPLTHLNLCASARHIGSTLALSPEDCCLNVMPLFHIHGLVAALLSSLAAGGSVVCSPGFYAPQFPGWLGAFRPTWYTAVPTMHQAILARARGQEGMLARQPLRFLRSSSSALAPQLMEELERTFRAPVIEAYGMTEAAHQMASNPLPPGARKPGSVGRAAGPEVAIMDEAGCLLPTGEVGEIVIRGPNVMPGYVSNPTANEQAFTNGWFRTGDQGRLDTDHYLFIMGRLKEIINRGGEKISPREVDEVLLAHRAVAQAVTFAMPDPKLGEEVAAAVVLRPEAAAGESELQEFAAARLAACKVPRRVVILDDIPKGPTGKLQRIGLADKLGLKGVQESKQNPKPEAGRAAPHTAHEEQLLAIWRAVLAIDPIGVADNFFELGGDSVLAVQVLARVRDTFGVQLSIVVFFNHPTVAALAGEIQRFEATAPAAEADAIRPMDRTGPLPLSSAQQRLWFLDRFEPHNPAYNRPAALRLRGPLERSALERSLAEIVRRHEVLRTCFSEKEGRPVPVVLPKLELSLPCTDLRALPEDERLNEACRLAAVEARQKLDLLQGPLIKARLLQLEGQDHMLLLVFHHIVFDGWSMEVLRRELAAHYDTFTRGEAKPVPADLAVQYLDYAHWQQQRLQRGQLQDDLAWWQQHLAGELPVLELPTDHSRPPALTGAGARHTHRLPAALAQSLRAVGQREGATLFMTLLTAFEVLLHRHTGQEDLIVGCPVAGRNRTEIEGLIGVFINTLALRTQLTGNPPFRELLAQVRRIAVQAYARQEVPFEKIVDALQPKRLLNRTPAFQVTFQLRNLPATASAGRSLRMEDFDFDSGTAKFDLSLEVMERSDGLHCVFEYSTDLFDAASIRQLAGHYQTLLESIVVKPESRIGDLPMLSEREREQVLVEWSGRRADYPRDRCIPELFEEQVRRAPEAVALVFEDQRLTYNELNDRANRLAHWLRAQGVGPETLVGLCARRSFEPVVGMLGILKAGAAYLPLNLDDPPQRLAFMLEECGAPVLLTQAELRSKLPAANGSRVICFEGDQEAFNSQSTENPRCRTTAGQLAYVMYTSGSTGRPKGVAVTHRGVVRLVKDASYVSLTPAETLLHLAPFSFDASTFEIWGALLNGARLVIMPPHPPSLEDIGEAIRRHGVTTLWLTAGLFHAMVDQRLDDLKPLRQLLAGGDVLSVPRVRKFLEQVTGCRLINGYGPTENTTFTCCHTVTPADTCGVSIPIGRPIANTQVYILDPRQQPAPVGVPGELCIAGDGLARGYYKRPELTAAAFGPNPFSQEPGARLYRSGDRARWRADGSIEFLGRLDRQVKLNGFRVEPGEVEAVLAEHPAVREAAAAVQKSPAGNQAVVAGAVPKEGVQVTPGELREFLRQRLPDYLMPASLVLLNALPLTPHGKVDWNALPTEPPGEGRATVTATEVLRAAPDDELERALADIWARHLKIQAVGVRDNFFELGGNSLLALSVFSDVARLTGTAQPLSILFEAPTLGQLAAVLRQEDRESTARSIVAIQPRGSRPPLFCVPGAGVDALCYRDLARQLGEDQPLYSFTPPGFDGRRPPLDDITTMAACYLREMRKVQPAGPYRIGGLSFGGLVAWEMACQLRARGEVVALLVLFDTYGPGLDKGRRPDGGHRCVGDLAFELVQKARLHSSTLAHLLPGQRWPYLRDKSRHRLALLFGRPDAGRASPLIESARRVYVAHLKALHAYQPPAYPGRVVLFRGHLHLTRQASRDRTLGWNSLAGGGLEVHDLPGFHHLMIAPPFVELTASTLQACLAKSHTPHDKSARGRLPSRLVERESR